MLKKSLSIIFWLIIWGFVIAAIVFVAVSPNEINLGQSLDYFTV